MDWRYLTDCKFYLDGKCLNRSCVYRHPRLDGLEHRICFKWSQYKCFDVLCKFQHPSNGILHVIPANVDQDKQSSVLLSSSEAMLKSSSEREVCKFFMMGKCKARGTCPYLHELPPAEFKRFNDVDTSAVNKDLPNRTIVKEILNKYSMSNTLKRISEEQIGDKMKKEKVEDAE